MSATIHGSRIAVSNEAKKEEPDLLSKAQAIIAKRKDLLDRLAKQ